MEKGIGEQVTCTKVVYNENKELSKNTERTTNKEQSDVVATHKLNQNENSDIDSKKRDITPKKQRKDVEVSHFQTPEKNEEIRKYCENENIYITPVKFEVIKDVERDKTPEQSMENGCKKNSDSQTETGAILNVNLDEGMMSEVQQAKQLIAASENYFKSLEITPVKQMNSQSPQHSLKTSPGTPGRYKRAQLITLDSPKSKKQKQI